MVRFLQINFQKSLAAILPLACLFAVPALAGGEPDFLQIKPRGYGVERKREFKPGAGGVLEMTADYPEDAAAFVKSTRAMMMRQHHKGTFTQEGNNWVLKDETSHKTMVIKLRHASRRKPTDLRGLQAACDLFPGSILLLTQVYREAEKQKNWQLALTYYRKAFDPGPKSTNFESLLDGGRDSFQEGDIAANCAYYELMMGHYSSAVKLLTKAIGLAPESEANYQNRAEAYRRLHKPDLADKDDAKLQQLRQKHRRAERGHQTGGGSDHDREGDRSFLAPLMIEVGDYERGLKALNAHISREPEDHLARLNRARVLLRLGKYKEALADYRTLLIPAKGAADFKAEMAIAEKLAKNGPPPYGDLSVLKSASGGMDQQEGRGRQRGISIAEIAADHHGDFRVYAAVCNKLFREHEWKALDPELDKVLAIVPGDNNAVRSKIQSSEALYRWPEAEKYCNRYLDLLAKNKLRFLKMDFLEYVYSVRALARRAQKNFGGAIDDESMVLRLAPESCQAFCDRGDAYMQAGNLDLARADYTSAIQYADPGDAGPYLRRAAVYERLKKTDLATADRDKALSITKPVEGDAQTASPD